jgi:hypothetical protein
MNAQEAGVHFKGILANVDSSILQVDFNHGFKIEFFSEEEAVTLFSFLGKIPRMAVAQKYFSGFQCLNYSEQRMYVISKSLENVSGHDSFMVFNGIVRFDNTLVRDHLEPMIRLMRLFKEGDIRMPAKFYYQLQNDKIQEAMRVESGRYISNEPYHLEASEVPVLRSFIQSVELPFKRDFLHLAFENFELSYEISDMQLAFLVLMIGLETLLNPSHYEVRYRVSRNVAVLLGENREHSEEIFAKVKGLYDKRSEIVHSGKRRTVEKRDLLELRDYLRKAIIEIHHIGKEKNEITDLLDSHGFGEEIETS